MNAIRVIHPYKDQGLWVFDDPAVGLVREPFVAGADTIIERMVAAMAQPERGFTLLFSAGPFPGYELEAHWSREEMGGHWYRSPELGLEGWLCPALFRYFGAAPERLYAQFRERAAG